MWTTQWYSRTLGVTGTRLAAHRPHHLLGVALAGGGAPGHGLLDAPQVLPGELDAGGARVLLQVLAALGAGDGDYVLALGEQPRERELPRRHALAFGDLAHPVGELHVLHEVLLSEAREAGAAGVLFWHVLDALEASGQEAAPKGRVGYETDTELAQGRQHFVLHVAGK